MINLNGHKLDILQENIAKLKVMFPEVITEIIKGYREDKSAIIEYAVDSDKLKQLLGGYVDDSTEKYNFSWNDKGKALSNRKLFCWAIKNIGLTVTGLKNVLKDSEK